MTAERDAEMRSGGMALPIRNSVPAIPLPWRGPLIALGFALVATILLLHETVLAMVRTWSRSNSFGHGFIVVPLSLYLVWLRRRELAVLVPRPSWAGVLVVAAAGFLWLTADAASVAVVEQFAAICILQGVVIAILGPRMAWQLAFPLAFLFFAVPAGEALLPWMQNVTAAMIVHVLNWVRVPVFLDGYYLLTPSATFHVAEACAGLRYLVSSVVVGTLFANLIYRSFWRRASFVLVSLLVPIVANGVRASMIVLLAYYSGGKIATGVDHFIYGWVFLSVVTFLLLMIGMALRERNAPPPESTPAADTSRPLSAATLLSVTAGTLLAVAAAPSAHLWIQREQPIAKIELAPPSPNGESWREIAVESFGWRPHAVGADAEATRAFQDAGHRVSVNLAYYAYDRQDAEAISSANSFTDQIWVATREGWSPVVVDGSEISVEATYLRGPDRNLLVYHWYWTDGDFIGNPYLAKARQAMAALLGRPRSAALVTVAVEYGFYDRPPAGVLRDFVRDLGPLAPVLRDAARPSS